MPPSSSTAPERTTARVSAAVASRSLCISTKGGPVLHVEITGGELGSRQALGPVHDQADRGWEINEAQFVRSEDRPRGNGAFELIEIKAAAGRANRPAGGLRPAQCAEPPIGGLLALGVDAPERQRACRSREKKMLRHSGSPAVSLTNVLIMFTLHLAGNRRR